MKANIRLVLFPVLLCALLTGLQFWIDKMTEGDREKVETACAPERWLPGNVPVCAVTNPAEWAPLLQIPGSPAVRTSLIPFEDLPDQSCRLCNKPQHMCRETCPVTMLFTGNNKSFAEGIEYIYIRYHNSFDRLCFFTFMHGMLDWCQELNTSKVKLLG